MWFAVVLLFVAMPLIELFLLYLLWSATSIWVTLGLVLLTGILGGGLAKWQGLRTVRRIREQMRHGRMPAGEVLDGMMILIAALLLLTPGVLTDVVGVTLLIPPIRSLYKLWGGRLLARQLRLPDLMPSARRGSPESARPRRSSAPTDGRAGDGHRPPVLDGTVVKKTP